MKLFKYLFIAMLAIVNLASCNSEDNDYDIEYTAIHPLGGQYAVTIYKDKTEVTKTYCYVANTVDNDADLCWVRLGSYTTATNWAINGKLKCDVKSLSFSGDQIENLSGNVPSSAQSFSIVNGKVELKSITAPSGTVTDKISFSYTTTKDPGVTYTVEGYRFTWWEDDSL